MQYKNDLLDFNELIEKGEKVREIIGDSKAAISEFVLAYNFATSNEQRSTALRQIGLCEEHLGNMDRALKYYHDALEEGQSAEPRDEASMARALRHISSVKRKQGLYDEAIEKAILAWSHMNSVRPPPTDIVWVTHGVVQVLVEAGKGRDEIKRWLKRESSHILYMLRNEANDIRRWVWFSGWLMDLHKVYGAIAWPAKALAYRISKKAELTIRQEQIEGKRL